MPLPEPYLLVVYTVALASVARLITIDPLLDAPRDALVSATVKTSGGARAFGVSVTESLDDKRWSLGWFAAALVRLWTYLIRFAAWVLGHWATCPWCIGFWLALLMLWGRPHWENPVVLTLALAMAMRQVAGLLADRG